MIHFNTKYFVNMKILWTKGIDLWLQINSKTQYFNRNLERPDVAC